MPALLLALLVQTGPLPGFAVGDRCGDDGPRYQVVYATPGADRRAELAPIFRQVLAGINAAFGGVRTLRLTCDVELLPMPVTAGYGDLIAALPATPDRKYLVFFDTFSDRECGRGSVYPDDDPGQANQNNQTTTYAVVWSNCWTSRIPAHEVFHSLGAVQRSAPFADRDFHCYDPANVGGIFDCSMASYYDPAPPPGSYLADHWNTANSRFLDVTPFFPLYLPAVPR